MNEVEDIKTSIRRLAGASAKTIIIAEVIAIDEAKQLIDVTPVDGDAEIYDVRLQPVKTDEGVIVYPKKGSSVVVAMVDEVTGFVIQSDVVQGLAIKIEGSDLHEEMNNLFEMLDKLIGILNEFQLATNMGPTVAVMPHIITKLQQEKQSLSSVKTAINKILKPF